MDTATAGVHRHLLLPPPSSPFSPPPLPFHLLELTLISAQDLHPAARRAAVGAYAVAWADPDHKLRTRPDTTRGTDPAWNDRIVFRLDPAFLRSDTAALSIEIYAARHRPCRDALLGTARVVLSTVQPSPGAVRLAALQVRRPASLRPQGIVNVAIALLDPAFAVYASGRGPPAAFLIGEKGWMGAEREPVEKKVKAGESWKVEMTPEWRSEGKGGLKKRRGGMLACCHGSSFVL